MIGPELYLDSPPSRKFWVLVQGENLFPCLLGRVRANNGELRDF